MIYPHSLNYAVRRPLGLLKVKNKLKKSLAVVLQNESSFMSWATRFNVWELHWSLSERPGTRFPVSTDSRLPKFRQFSRWMSPSSMPAPWMDSNVDSADWLVLHKQINSRTSVDDQSYQSEIDKLPCDSVESGPPAWSITSAQAPSIEETQCRCDASMNSSLPQTTVDIVFIPEGHPVV